MEEIVGLMLAATACTSALIVVVTWARRRGRAEVAGEDFTNYVERRLGDLTNQHDRDLNELEERHAHQLADLEERLDFTERMLTRQRVPELPAPEHTPNPA